MEVPMSYWGKVSEDINFAAPSATPFKLLQSDFQPFKEYEMKGDFVVQIFFQVYLKEKQ